MKSRLERPVTRNTLIGVAVAVVVLVGAFVVCVAGLDHRSDARTAATARDTVSEQAADAVAAVFSVSEKTWRHDRQAAKTHLADPMSTSLASALARGPAEGVISVEWEPQHAATVDIDQDTATAIVVARVTVTSRRGPPQTADRTVQTSLRRVEGRWLVTGMDELR
ncbi:hypothetical protein [Gordonia sp. MP11Mi]|uniref:Mce-associated membrane protein n=1 Tax=Gordonia sp. MP11Mi TaxID=3022769 RepID=A0AA97CT28_9ACTN